ncbi:response regulator [Foetidibacter luteolus]|uniref:response regulator n=1 Tax=Foetidibacter luteolus TaxID=2608880 RepID=UPI00129B5562|nr:response regulator [Foetidibacter luteolus]
MKNTLNVHPSAATQGSKLILSGEDDIDDQEMLEEALIALDEKFVIVHIDNGKKLLEYLDSLPDEGLPCLVILDYNMPGLNASEILKWLSNEKRYMAIPKVVWSTSGSNAYKTHCIELGASDYLVKPSDMKSLQEAVRYMTSFCNS